MLPELRSIEEQAKKLYDLLLANDDTISQNDLFLAQYTSNDLFHAIKDLRKKLEKEHNENKEA